MTAQTPVIPPVSPNEPQSGWWNWLQSLARTINLIIDWIHQHPTDGGGGGGGTVTSVAAGTGLTASPSPIVGAGTISLATPVSVPNGGTGLATLAQYNVVIGNGTGVVSLQAPGVSGTIFRSNGPSALPSYSSLTALLDVMVGTAAQGQILYRGSAAWGPLAPGTAGQFLQTGGAGANVTWATAGGSSDLSGMTAGQIPIAATATTITSSANLSGDVVSTATLATTIQPNAVTTAKIADAAVTYAKIQNVTAASLLGNPTGAGAAPSAITLGAGLSFAGSVLNSSGGIATPVSVPNGGTGLATLPQYNVLAGNGTASVSPLLPGSSGTILRSNGASAMPSYGSLTALLDLMAGTAVHGQILYRGSAVWTTLAPSTAGLFLRTGGSGANPTWAGAAPLDSPVFTGTPSLPTGTTGITQAQNVANTTLATTAFTRVGTATNNNAAAGQLGEFISSEIAGASAVALTTLVWVNVTSISLTAGDWDVWASIGYTLAASTTCSDVQAQISTTSLGGMTPPNGGGYFVFQATLASGGSPLFPGMQRRISIAGTTTIYLVALAVFGVSTCGAYGGIYARRVR